MSKKKSEKYTLTVTRKQLKLIEEALESYARIRMNQWFDFSTEIAEYGYVYDRSNPDNDRLFSDYIERRNDSKEMFEKAFERAVPNPNDRRKTPAVQNAIDIWHVIRYLFYQERPEPKDHYTVDSFPPFQTGEEPLPTLERIEE